MISKGDLDAASRRELERHNAAPVPGFVRGQWDGEASGLLKQKKKASLTFTSLLTSLLGAAFGNPTPGLMDRGADLIVLLGCSYVAELWMCC